MASAPTPGLHRAFGFKIEELPLDLRAAIDLAKDVETNTRTLFAYASPNEIATWAKKRPSDADVERRARWLKTLRTILEPLGGRNGQSLHMNFPQLMIRLASVELLTRQVRDDGVPCPIVRDWQLAWNSIAPTLAETAYYVGRCRRGESKAGDDVWWLRTCLEWWQFEERCKVLLAAPASV